MLVPQESTPNPTPADPAIAPTPTETGTAVPVSPVTEPAADPGATVAAAPAPAAPVRPEGLADAYWDAEAGVKWGELQARLGRADELEAAEAARREGVPENVDGYKIEVDGDPILDLAGRPLGFDAADPLAKGFVELAHKHGAPQALVSGALRLYAESVLTGARADNDAMSAEVAKLGDKATDRVKSVSDFIKQHAGQHAGDALASLGSAGAVQAWEAVMQAFAGTVVTAPPTKPAVRPDTAAILYPNG